MTGFLISKEVEFDAGHRVPNHKSKCRNPHGHRYTVRATIGGDLVTTSGASNEGMLADFGDLKTLLTSRVHDPLDHGFIVYEEDWDMRGALGVRDTGPQAGESDMNWKIVVFPYIPTAENLARWSWEQLLKPVDLMGFELAEVEVWETPTSVASYSGP